MGDRYNMLRTTVVRYENGRDLVFVTDEETNTLRCMSATAYIEYLRRVLR